uniref:Telomeric repeat-binding factor 2-interacting protein 1 n=1 Tax=Timema tahoe TaxID=61484 RepID=A0A7R9NUN7_9NEOP|nr:unnamed protein product [Timema tahoe]
MVAYFLYSPTQDHRANSLTSLRAMPWHPHRSLTYCTLRMSGEVVSVAGPYTIPLISPDMQYEGEDEVFSFEYITDCAKNNRQLNKRSQFKPEFNFCDILEKKITWSEARTRTLLPHGIAYLYASTNMIWSMISSEEVFVCDVGRSRWKIDNINLDPSPLLQTLSSIKPTSRSYTLKEERTILKYIADNDMYDKVKGRFMWQSMASSQVVSKTAARFSRTKEPRDSLELKRHEILPNLSSSQPSVENESKIDVVSYRLEEGLCGQKKGNKRTWQSLKEHFIKSMIPRIDSFNLTKQEKNKFMCKFN